VLERDNQGPYLVLVTGGGAGSVVMEMLVEILVEVLVVVIGSGAGSVCVVVTFKI
jgi:hypothetical protein